MMITCRYLGTDLVYRTAIKSRPLYNYAGFRRNEPYSEVRSALRSAHVHDKA